MGGAPATDALATMPDNYFSAVTDALTRLLTMHADLFVHLGTNLFRDFATILIAWYGIKMALSSADGSGHLHLGHFARLLLTIAFGDAMITYYAQPIPGFGVSFSHLITDQATALATQIEQASAQEIQQRLTDVYVGMEKPSLLDVIQILRYFLTLCALAAAQFAVLAVISYGFVATGVIVLVGPIFIPFFIVPTLEWLFWGWLRAFLQYAFYQVIANAFVFVFGNLLIHFLDQHPPPFTDEWVALLFVPLLFLLVAFVYGLLKVPALVNAIFTGRSGDRAVPPFVG